MHFKKMSIVFIAIVQIVMYGMEEKAIKCWELLLPQDVARSVNALPKEIKALIGAYSSSAGVVWDKKVFKDRELFKDAYIQQSIPLLVTTEDKDNDVEVSVLEMKPVSSYDDRYRECWNKDKTRRVRVGHATISISEPPSHNEFSIVQHGGYVSSVHFNGNGTRLLSASHDGTAKISDIATGQSLAVMVHDLEIDAAWFDNNETEVHTFSFDWAIHMVWKQRSLEHIMLRKLLHLWLELEKPDKSIKSPVELLSHVADVLYCDYQELNHLWSKVPFDMQQAMWRHISRMIDIYGKEPHQIIIMTMENLPYKYTLHGKLIDGFLTSTLEGFEFKKNQVELLPVGRSEPKCVCYISNKSYNSKDYATLLSKGLVSFYPLFFHKQLRYLSAGAQMKIIRKDSNGFFHRIILPDDMENRILNYLLYNGACSLRQCFDFFKEVFFGKLHDCRDCKVIPFFKQLEVVVDEATIIPGDGIVLFSNVNTPAKNSIALKHYAIALGDGFYISKFGNGGKLHVSTMNAMLQVYDCIYFAKVNKSVACLKDFIKTCCGKVIIA